MVGRLTVTVTVTVTITVRKAASIFHCFIETIKTFRVNYCVIKSTKRNVVSSSSPSPEPFPAPKLFLPALSLAFDRWFDAERNKQ